ncbi:MAG: hypothetical protein AAGC55_21825 [Myxococcota bacterium]
MSNVASFVIIAFSGVVMLGSSGCGIFSKKHDQPRTPVAYTQPMPAQPMMHGQPMAHAQPMMPGNPMAHGGYGPAPTGAPGLNVQVEAGQMSEAEYSGATCSVETYRQLRRSVKNKCRGQGALTCHDAQSLTCEELHKRAFANEDCQDAREDLNFECFGNRNDGQKIASQRSGEDFTDCLTALAQKGC